MKYVKETPRNMSMEIALKSALNKHVKQKDVKVLDKRNEDNKGENDEGRQDKTNASNERAGKRDNKYGVVRC